MSRDSSGKKGEAGIQVCENNMCEGPVAGLSRAPSGVREKGGLRGRIRAKLHRPQVPLPAQTVPMGDDNT